MKHHGREERRLRRHRCGVASDVACRIETVVRHVVRWQLPHEWLHLRPHAASKLRQRQERSMNRGGLKCAQVVRNYRYEGSMYRAINHYVRANLRLSICNCRTHDRPGLFRVLISPGAPRRIQLPTSDLRQGSGNATTSMTFPKWQVQIHKMRFRGRWSTAAADIRATTSLRSCATSCQEIGSNILHVANLEFSILKHNR